VGVGVVDNSIHIRNQRKEEIKENTARKNSAKQTGRW
jgi:hypothetical protein